MPMPRPEPNVTPLVDILLVLLVIFMAALPLSQRAIETDLPAEAGASTDPRILESVVLEYSADGAIAINKHGVLLNDLEARLREIYVSRRDKTLYIAGAPSLAYKRIIGVMDAARGAGVTRLGVITEGLRAAASR